jgi:hypothetical protein
MTDIEKSDYRKILEKEFVDKDLEIETTLSYISVGALGFFITINEKFLKIQTADCKLILILSLFFLFLSFVLILYRKSRTSHHDLILMGFIDKMESNSVDDDNHLLDLWDNSHRELNGIRKFIYISLSIGIGLQILFLAINF